MVHRALIPSFAGCCFACCVLIMPSALAQNQADAIWLSLESQDQVDSVLQASIVQYRELEQQGDSLGMAESLGKIASFYSEKSELLKALEYYSYAAEISAALRDQSGQAEYLGMVGRTYRKLGNDQKALQYLGKSLPLAEAVGDSLASFHTSINIGAIYHKTGDETQAKTYFYKSLDLAERIDFRIGQVSALTRLAGVYQKTDGEKSREYFQQALQLSEEIGYTNGVAISLDGLGYVYKAQGDFAKSIDFHTQSLRIRERMGRKNAIAKSYGVIGKVYFDQGNYLQAIDWCQRELELASSLGLIMNERGACQCLYESHKAQQQPQQALGYLERFLVLEDSLQSRNTLGKLQQMELTQKITADSLQRIEQALQTQVLHQQELNQRNYLLFGGLGLALLGVIVFRNQQQRKARKRLEQINHLKDQFLANTSHELRTPLNGIIGITEGMLDQAEDPDTRKNLSMVISSGKRLASLVNDLLDFSRLQHADLQLQQRPIDLHSVAEVVLQVSQPLAKGKALQLENDIPADLPAVFADEERLTQVMFNLVGNALKFTEKGHVRISASEKNDQIEVAISDTGIGIPKDKQKAIFRAFEQADGSISRTFTGTGLGLTISKVLIEQQQGSMWLESEVDQGSTFYFTLPLSPEKSTPTSFSPGSNQLSRMAPMQQASSPASMPLDAIGPMISDSHIRILIVDDEPINHQVLHNHLRADTYEVVSAMNGEEALEILARDHDFDLVLLDIMMPRMSGYQVCKRIRETFLPSELPVIMVTAKNQVMDLVEGLQTGANDYMVKPFSKDEFLARLTTHLNLHRISRATYRFVPSEFIHTLGKDAITDVKLGDNISRDVTVFFSDIRSYTTLAEQMTPDENFRFVNAYAERMGPIIQAHAGFVNQYLGDGIMALFQRNPADAVRASIDMQAELRAYNVYRNSRGRSPLRVGMGMHEGPLIMGIIGDHKRTDPAIISDTVNTAARLEGLTKYFACNVICSESVFQHLTPAEQAQCRYLGPVQLKGKKEPIGIYECLAGASPEALAQKQASMETFSEALEAYLRGELALAKVSFAQCLDAWPTDGPAQYFQQMILDFEQQGRPEPWTGVLEMSQK